MTVHDAVVTLKSPGIPVPVPVDLLIVYVGVDARESNVPF